MTGRVSADAGAAESRLRERQKRGGAPRFPMARGYPQGGQRGRGQFS
jgi:hypothetical protein